MYLNFETKNNSYRCKLSTRAIVDIEDRLGDNPINIISTMVEDKLPKLSTMLVILYYSLKDMNHGIKFDEIYDIYDDYLANGGNIMSCMEFIMNLFTESGIIGKADEDQKEGVETEKN